MTFEAKILPERELIFGGRSEEKDPRIGLQQFGPFRFEDEKEGIYDIKIGIIGNNDSIDKGIKILDLIKNPYESSSSNKWLNPPYPGLSDDTHFKCNIHAQKIWQQLITQGEIDHITKVLDSNERIGRAVELYKGKVKNIVEGEDQVPDVIICTLPKEIEEYCGISERTRGAKKAKFTPHEKEIEELRKQNQTFLAQWGVVPSVPKSSKVKAYDFHNALKGKIMAFPSAIPIQLLRETTMDKTLADDSTKISRQDPSSFAWNFATALFYKAKGKPWRLAKLRDDTCYVGISFYHDKLSPSNDFQTSMAQVFTHTGEGLVLRGEEVYIDESSEEPHLTEEQAEKLLRDAIAMYLEKAKRNPIRVVIHKETQYTSAEKKGFSTAIGTYQKDFVTINMRNYDINFMRSGTYPVLRGTTIKLTENQHLLYTSGFIPRIRTYPGHRIPQPLLVRHEGDSRSDDILDEILGLTKLNWNTTSFATSFPITLEFSKRVGEILSELEKGSTLQNHYRFYM